ncbi:Transient receptor putative cation channel sub V member 6 [Blyttiomyces sp. JEL0837]|nr:Transient receptor putative cation channel sub V member 6 [Blyttiomyces sp. JEL0837]
MTTLASSSSAARQPTASTPHFQHQHHHNAAPSTSSTSNPSPPRRDDYVSMHVGRTNLMYGGSGQPHEQDWSPNFRSYTPYVTSREHSRAKTSLPVLLNSFYRMVVTGGEDNGRPTKIFQIPGDILRDKMGRCKESIWRPVINRSDPKEVKRVYDLYEKQFKEEFGFDMYLERGAEGENILQYALLVNNVDLLKFLLGDAPYEGMFPKHILAKMMNHVYEGETYWAEHACHIAAVVFEDDPYWMSRLIENGADPHKARARGTFFRPEGSLYMGETVLAFAACMGHTKIVRYLIDEVHMDPNMVDSFGNNVLHVLCWWGFYSDDRQIKEDETDDDDSDDDDDEDPQILPGSIYDMLARGGSTEGRRIAYDHLDDLERSKIADDSLANANEETPFIVAVKQGRVDMVRALVIYNSVPLWNYGPIHMMRFPLSEIDTWVEEETMNHRTGALEHAVRARNIDVIKLPIFEKLLEGKWILYAQRVFYFRFLTNLAYIILFTAMIALLPNGQEFYTDHRRSDRLPYIQVFNDIMNNPTHEWSSYQKQQVSRFIIEVILILSNLAAAIREFKEFRNAGLSYFTGFGNFENGVQWLNIGLFTLGCVLRFWRINDGEVIVWGLCSIVGWLYLLYFSKGFRTLGPLCIVFDKLVRQDLVRFIGLVGVFLIGFGEAIWLLMAPFGSLYENSYVNYSTNSSGTVSPTDAPDDYPRGVAYPPSYNAGWFEWKGLRTGLLWSLRFFFGQGSYDDLRNSHTGVTLWIYLIFFLLVNILLINVFIAMLNQTFSAVLANSEDEWKLARAKLIMEIDENINNIYKRIKRLNKGHLKEPPVTRIGVPREIPNLMVKPKFLIDIYRENMESEGGDKWYRRISDWGSAVWNGDVGLGTALARAFGFGKGKAEEHEKQKYHNYAMLLQMVKRDGVMVPTRMIASLDDDSPLSGKSEFKKVDYSYQSRKVTSRRN